MKILDIRETTISLGSPTKNADINFSQMTASAVVVTTDAQFDNKPLRGLGFDSIGRYGHGSLLRERFIPRLLHADEDSYQDDGVNNIDPKKIWQLMMADEKPGGHGERAGAVGLLDAAIWDIVAKVEEKPLWQVLAQRFNNEQALQSIPVYVSGGHYCEKNDLEKLREQLIRSKDNGHNFFKIKFGGKTLAEDCKRIECALNVIGDAGSLAIDANCCFTGETTLNYMNELEAYDLAWIEEPLGPLDYRSHADFCATYKTPVATGENIFSAADLQNLLSYAGLRANSDFLQMDISLSYGIPEYLRMLEFIESNHWDRKRCIPHAGHLFALHVVAGLNLGAHETAMDSSLPIAGFIDAAIVEDGYIQAPSYPGVGFEEKAELYDLFTPLLN
jgi:L-alanine-DL-glutamate epimerase-like enolase superfamily enzyme